MTVSFDVTLVGPADLAEAWTAAFRGTPVSVQAGDILARARGQALVSPANNFGWMSGGLDLAIAGAYGPAVDIGRRVQAAIQQDAGGELPVGQALVVPTPEGRFSHLVCAPTMRTPRPVATSLNAYLAFRALLLAVCGVERPTAPRSHHPRVLSRPRHRRRGHAAGACGASNAGGMGPSRRAGSPAQSGAGGERRSAVAGLSRRREPLRAAGRP